jgi:hypothetical protein
VIKVIDGRPIVMVDVASCSLISLSGYDFQYSEISIDFVSATITQFELNQAL